MPEKIDLSTFTRAVPGQSYSHARGIIDVAALIHWKSDLNFHDLLPDSIDHSSAQVSRSSSALDGTGTPNAEETSSLSSISAANVNQILPAPDELSVLNT